MLHSLATAQASPDEDTPPAPVSGAVLRGPSRPDLIRDELLCEIFATTAASHPSTVAIITAEGNLTYAEVDAKAEALARVDALRPALSTVWFKAKRSDVLRALVLEALPILEQRFGSKRGGRR